MGFLLLLLTLFSSISFADILFIGINDNPKEIEHARAAAKTRKEKLIVWPDFSEQERKEFQRVAQPWKKAVSDRNKCIAKIPKEDRAINKSCDALNKLVEDGYKKVSEAKTKLPKVTKELLREKLLEIENSDTDISSMIISSDDGNGHFGGLFGGLYAKELKEILEETPKIKQSVESLYLWGCYSTKVGTLEVDWMHLFPNNYFIAGFDERGPLGDKPYGYKYLQELLEKEEKFKGVKDKALLQKVFKGLKYEQYLHTAVCVEQDLVVNKAGVVSIQDALKNCHEVLKIDTKELEETYHCYFIASEGCEDLPKDKGSGPLRDFYKIMMDKRECSAVFKMSTSISIEPDNIIQLIYNQMLRANFATTYRFVLKDIDAMIDKYRWPASLKMSHMDQLTRKEYLENLTKLGTIQRQLELETKAAEGVDATDPSVALLNDYLSGLAGLDKPQCVPFGWVNEISNEVLKCGHDTSLKQAKAKAYNKALSEDIKLVLENKSPKIQELDQKIKSVEENARLNGTTEEGKKELHDLRISLRKEKLNVKIEVIKEAILRLDDDPLVTDEIKKSYDNTLKQAYEEQKRLEGQS